MLIINDGTPGNTIKIQSVPNEIGLLLYYEYIYIYIGTLEHWNTKV